MAQDINSELEYKNLTDQMKGKDKFNWMVSKVYFLSLDINKISSTQDDISKRLEAVEANCKKRTEQCAGNSSPWLAWLKNIGVGGLVMIVIILSLYIYAKSKGWF